jgi:iron(III) transport system substrate-binding protein
MELDGDDVEDTSGLDALIEDAKAEGELIVYGSCEEEYLAAACEHFQELYGITVSYQRLSTGEVQSKIEEENGNPSGDVWFGGTTDPYNVAAGEGLLEAYEATNASHLISDTYRDADGYWYGIYKGILGFMVNNDELERMGLDAPTDWQDLLDEKYQGLIWLSNYNTAGTAKLVVNTMIQKYGHDEGIQYLVDLDKNIEVYTKSGSGPSKNVGTGECVIGIGFLHDGITQIVDNGYGNIGLVIPSSGTSFEVGATAIFKGCAHDPLDNIKHSGIISILCSIPFTCLRQRDVVLIDQENDLLSISCVHHAHNRLQRILNITLRSFLRLQSCKYFQIILIYRIITA